MSKQVYLKVGLVGYCRSGLMVRFMDTKWGETVESKREGHVVFNSDTITSLDFTNNVLYIKRSKRSSARRSYINSE